MDSTKHSGVTSLFNQYFIITGTASKISFKTIQALMDLRHEGDHQDFAKITEEKARGSIETAQSLIDSMRDILKKLLMV